MKNILCCSLMLLTSLPLFSERISSSVLLNEPSYSGSGCEEGTLSYTLTPDHTALSVIPDDLFMASEGNGNNETISIFCTLKIPLDIPQNEPQGAEVALSADVRGYARVPCHGDWVDMKVDYSIVGYENSSTVHFSSSYDDGFHFDKLLYLKGCERTAEIMLKTTLTLHSEGCAEEAFVVVDINDISSRPRAAITAAKVSKGTVSKQTVSSSADSFGANGAFVLVAVAAVSAAIGAI